MKDSEIGLAADRAWQVEFGDMWRAEKKKWLASRQPVEDCTCERQAAEFAEVVAKDVAEMRATFRDMQATLAENARLRDERERRLEDWAIEDAWARLRGGR